MREQSLPSYLRCPCRFSVVFWTSLDWPPCSTLLELFSAFKFVFSHLGDALHPHAPLSFSLTPTVNWTPEAALGSRPGTPPGAGGAVAGPEAQHHLDRGEGGIAALRARTG